MTQDQVQEQIIEEFAIFDQWLDKYSYLIELSGELEPLDDKYRNDQYVINGCQSRVWIAAEVQGDTISFTADSDAIITKGIIALLIRVFSGRTPQEIIDTEPYFIESIGLSENLSPTRANGLLAMLKQIKLYALAYNNKK